MLKVIRELLLRGDQFAKNLGKTGTSKYDRNTRTWLALVCYLKVPYVLVIIQLKFLNELVKAKREPI